MGKDKALCLWWAVMGISGFAPIILKTFLTTDNLKLRGFKKDLGAFISRLRK